MLKKVFLFGAGAVIPWGGPTTYELTDLVRNSGFTVCNSDITISEFIYRKLIEAGYTNDEVNFETIINVLEELIIYHSEYNLSTRTPSLLRCFVNSFEHHEIFNYSIKDENRPHGYLLQIPKNTDYPYSNRALNGENPNVFFLLHLLSEILTVIVGKVSNYSYLNENSTMIESASIYSNNFIKWMGKLKFDSVLRIYTLNYDRLFKVLLKEINIHCFEGFDTQQNPYEVDIRADIPKIINDRNTDCHYNIHGSAWWWVKQYDWKGLYNPEVVYSGAPNLPVNDNVVIKNVQRGRPIMMTNIVTGYQKAEKSMFSPIKEMHSSFENDCITAETIYIVGYSFGDEHINDCIRIALRYNPKVRIEIIDPNFISNKEIDFALYTFPFTNQELLPKKINDRLVEYNDGLIKIHTITFEDFLVEYSKNRVVTF